MDEFNEADPPAVPTIDDFRDGTPAGNYRWLSNFHPCQVYLDFNAEDENEYDWENPSNPQIVVAAKPYPSVEHAYQAAKTLDYNDRDRIRAAAEPKIAKRLGRLVTMREDWERECTLSARYSAVYGGMVFDRAPFKVLIMAQLLKQKFPSMVTNELTEKLLRTYPRDLIEGNTWGDQFWGVSRGFGLNWLGKLLMRRREEIVTGIRTAACKDSRYEATRECSCYGCKGLAFLKTIGA